jgi:hypothetical protein
MFLTAVLKAHTDQTGADLPAVTRQTESNESHDADSDHIPVRLKADLARAAEERVLQLPSIHRSRWV